MKGLLHYVTEIACDREHSLGAVFLRPLLWVLSLVYGLAVACKRGSYFSGICKTFRAPVPVISVGNITAGGTGKTPFVVTLDRMLRDEGFRPMVLIRGYMAGQGGLSDEAEMLTQLIGPRVFVGADRVGAFKSAYREGEFDCVILDDGFQQWGFARDVDIVLLDAKSPFGNGALLPRGILRETKVDLKRAEVVVLTRSDKVSVGQAEAVLSRVRVLNPTVCCARGVHRVAGARDAFTGSTVTSADLFGPAGAFCAIGDPDSFKTTLQSSGVEVKVFSAFADHYRFTEEDLRKIVEQCRCSGISRVFVTHKDAVKISKFQDIFVGITVLILDIELTLTHGKTDIHSIIRRLCRP